MRVLKHQWIVAGLAVLMCGMAASAQNAPHWVGTWACAPMNAVHGKPVDWPINPEDHDVTVRDLVHVSLGGSVIRLRVSNELGNDAVFEFDKAVGDPVHPTQLLPKYDAEAGHTHLTNEGYQTVVNVIDLAKFE